MMVFAILGVNLLLLLSSDSQMAQFQALNMPAELADSTTGKEWLKAPLGIFRAITAVMTAAITSQC